MKHKLSENMKNVVDRIKATRRERIVDDMITTTGSGAYFQGKNININILSLFDQM